MIMKIFGYENQSYHGKEISGRGHIHGQESLKIEMLGYSMYILKCAIKFIIELCA